MIGRRVLRVGIVGATGYAGQELVRLVARHPHASIAVAMTSSAGDETRTLPALTGRWHGTLSSFSTDRLASETDLVFLALPDTVSGTIAGPLLDAGVKVFDLSGAFRLKDPAARHRWYPETPDDAPPAVYGLVERRREALAGASFVTCPGCYPTAALLALEPLVEAGVIGDETDIVIDAKSGISGAGRAPKLHTHFSERHGNVGAYGIFSHRHGAEIEQGLERPVTFVPHYVPLDRGILETIYTRVPGGTSGDRIREIYEGAYADAPFIRLRGPEVPDIRHVAHTNYCDIGWVADEDRGRLVVVSCLDNLVKGAAGQAVQAMNVALGLDERDGIDG